MKAKALLTIVLCWTTHAFAGTPLISLTPTVNAPTVIYPGTTAVAHYTVTNNTPKDLTLFFKSVASGISQAYGESGLSPNGLTTCRSTFELARNGGSCDLEVVITADQLNQAVQDGPMMCVGPDQPYPPYCYTPNIPSNKLMVQRSSTIPDNAATLTVTNLPSTLSTGSLATVTVTNNSSTETVNNIVADFSGGALDGKVKVLARNPGGEALCNSVAPGASCTLSMITYNQVAVPTASFTIRGSNSKTTSLSTSISYTAPNPGYNQLLIDTLTNADVWDNTPEIMSANYAFEGIQGIPNGETNVVNAGGAWSIISNTNPTDCYQCFTAAGDTNVPAIAYGYTTYYEDAMPICFSQPLLPSTVNPTDFRLTLNTGKVVTPDVASITPNFYYNERSCVVIFGTFGNRLPRTDPQAIYPTTVSIVAGASEGTQGSPINLTLIGPNNVETSMVGQSYNALQGADPYATGGGPTLLAAKLSVMNAVGQDVPAILSNDQIQPNDGVALYGNNAQYRLRMYTSGGFALGNFTPNPDVAISMMPNQYNIFFRIKVVDPDGNITWLNKAEETYTVNVPGGGTGNITVAGLAALGIKQENYNDSYQCSNNNYIDVILYGDEAAMHEITELDIPSSGVNPETGLPYLALYNPGGPGNNPTPGVLYSTGTVEIKQPVTDAINNPNVVNYP